MGMPCRMRISLAVQQMPAMLMPSAPAWRASASMSLSRLAATSISLNTGSWPCTRMLTCFSSSTPRLARERMAMGPPKSTSCTSVAIMEPPQPSASAARMAARRSATGSDSTPWCVRCSSSTISRSMPRGAIPSFSHRRRCSSGARSSGTSGPSCKPNCEAMRAARSAATWRRRENAVRTESMRRMGFRPGSPGMPVTEQEREDERGGYHRWRAALLIAPGRRYRLEYEGDHGGRAGGSDGEQAWTLRPPDPPPLPPLGFEVVSGLPVPALFRPAGLLAGFTLDMGGPVTACGREAIAVTAVPRHGAVGSGTSLRPPACDRVELIVDAGTGILLRREETFEGQLLTLFELTTVTMSPPEADDPARFAPPAGSRPVRDPEDAPGRSGLGWQVAALLPWSPTRR